MRGPGLDGIWDLSNKQLHTDTRVTNVANVSSPWACASRDLKGFDCMIEFHSSCESGWGSSSSSSSKASFFSAKGPGGEPPWAMKIANFKAMTYSWRIRMVETANFFKAFPGMVSTLHLFGVVVSGSVPSRITSRVSNNVASESGLPHAIFQSSVNDASMSSEIYVRYGVEGTWVWGRKQELLTHPPQARSLGLHCRLSVVSMDFPRLSCCQT
jgi:hypothetical protein